MSSSKSPEAFITLICDKCGVESVSLEPFEIEHVTASKRTYGWVEAPIGWCWDFVDDELRHLCGECRLVGAVVHERGPFD